MAIYNGKEILFKPQLKVGASDYDELANKPIINQDLSADGFTPEAGTYYRHVGTSGSAYTTGAIYYYDGSELKMLGGGGEKGDQGDTGLTALEYGDTHTEQYEGDIADEPISLPISGFNRTPVVGDKFLLVFNVTESGNSYIAPFTITEVGTDTAKASLNGANQQNITGAAGTTDYNQIENIPVINQDLSASGFTPVANTYYRHTGTTDTYTQGVIYYYDGTAYKALDGSGGGGSTTLNTYTFNIPISSLSTTENVVRFIHILCGAKKITQIALLRNKNSTNLVNTFIQGTPSSSTSLYAFCEFARVTINGFKYTFAKLASHESPTYSFKEGLFVDGSFTLSEITDATAIKVVYLNEVEITT